MAKCCTQSSEQPKQCWMHLRQSLVFFLVVGSAVFHLNGQEVNIDTSEAGRRQLIDGFGTCLAGDEATNSWWQELYFDDLGASMVRMDLFRPWPKNYLFLPFEQSALWEV